jgi:ferrous iron transport protein B
VGNYSGVTVDATEAHASFFGYEFNLTDLPGTYSLSCYSPEELYVRKYIIDKTPSVIVNVVDASNLERNLYLTTQLIDMDVPMIMALNMYDELRASGNKLNQALLGELLGVPVIPTVGRTGEGVKELFSTIIAIHEGRKNTFRHIHVNHGRLLEENIDKVEEQIRMNLSLTSIILLASSPSRCLRTTSKSSKCASVFRTSTILRQQQIGANSSSRRN